jgi:hypothetical protein
MDRIDLVVGAARQVMRLEIGREVLLVVAPRMVVLDLQVAIAPETLGDDEVVRFVAGREEHGPGESRRRDAGDHRRREPDGDRQLGQRPALEPVGVEHPRLPEDPRQLDGDDQPDHAADRPGQHLQHRHGVGQVGQIGQQQGHQPEHRQDERPNRLPDRRGHPGRCPPVDPQQADGRQGHERPERRPRRQQRDPGQAAGDRHLIEDATRQI